ncbi:O-antigen ligase family protein [Rhodopseudomonas sp. NSM]|uniref:O-antigen ligase family protein n=1 Tax=Rhodopseudomonas sp. NSM TaxID=3457630 RepID=UPI004035053D
MAATEQIGFAVPPATFQRRNIVLAFSLWLWCACLFFPLASVDVWAGESAQIPLYQMYQVGGLLQFILVSFAVGPRHISQALACYDPLQAAILAVILLSIALQFHGREVAILEGLTYTLLLLVVIACFSGLWTMPDNALADCFGGIAVTVFAFGIYAVAVHGWPADRRLGGIHPNMFGSVMLAGFMFSQFRRGYVMAVVRLSCLVLATAVSSRFAMIACVLSFLVFEVTSRPLGRRLALLALAGAVAVVLLPELLSSVLALNDPERNLDSGLTGRDEQWARAVVAIVDAPFGLGFKRPDTEHAGHNGYLRTLIEFGIIGGGVVITALLATVSTAVFAPARCRDDDSRRVAAARAGGLVALTFASFFQPQLFNLGDIHGLSMMLLLFGVRGRGPAAAAATR